MEPTPPEEDSFFGRLKGYFSEVEAWLSAGSSGLGNSMKLLEEQAGSGTWLEGKRFTSSSTAEELTAWAASLGIEP